MDEARHRQNRSDQFFEAYLDPPSIQASTRLPSFRPHGRTGSQEILDRYQPTVKKLQLQNMQKEQLSRNILLKYTSSRSKSDRESVDQNSANAVS